MRLSVLLFLGLVIIATPAIAADDVPYTCYAGAYQFGKGEFVVLSPGDDGTLRYRLLDGRSGLLYPQGAGRFSAGSEWDRESHVGSAQFESCESGRLQFQLREGPEGLGKRVPVTTTPTTFTSLGNTLHGELHTPASGKPRALVVLAYGSGRESAVTFNYLQHLLPLYDIAAFVFDKRGAGKSSGRFTVDFSELADDTIAAVAQARKLLDNPAVPVGLLGESQGGWVAPLAASRAPVDFVIVSFGLAIGPLDEDREEVFQELRSKGCGEPVLSEARELTLITRRVLLSRFTTGLEDLRRFKAAHAQEPWLKEVEGDFTGPMVQTPEDQFGKLIEALSFDAILDYDARATLERVRTPMLWVVAGQDTEAPSAPTLEVLRALQPDPGQLDIAVFPRADHGMIDMEMRDGKRRAMGHSPGYFDLLAHWIAERSLEGTFGAAQLQPDATNGRL